MNRVQRAVVTIGLVAIAAMGAFPPWVTAPTNRPVGFHFIITGPPVPSDAPVVWSGEHQRFEQNGRPIHPSNTSMNPILAVALDRVSFLRIDYRKLMIEWIVIAALVGAGVEYTGRPR